MIQLISHTEPLTTWLSYLVHSYNWRNVRADACTLSLETEALCSTSPEEWFLCQMTRLLRHPACSRRVLTEQAQRSSTGLKCSWMQSSVHFDLKRAARSQPQNTSPSLVGIEICLKIIRLPEMSVKSLPIYHPPVSLPRGRKLSLLIHPLLFKMWMLYSWKELGGQLWMQILSVQSLALVLAPTRLSSAQSSREETSQSPWLLHL